MLHALAMPRGAGEVTLPAIHQEAVSQWPAPEQERDLHLRTIAKREPYRNPTMAEEKVSADGPPLLGDPV